MKRYLAIILSAMMVISFSACQKENGNEAVDESSLEKNEEIKEVFLLGDILPFKSEDVLRLNIIKEDNESFQYLFLEGEDALNTSKKLLNLEAYESSAPVEPFLGYTDTYTFKFKEGGEISLIYDGSLRIEGLGEEDKFYTVKGLNEEKFDAFLPKDAVWEFEQKVLENPSTEDFIPDEDFEREMYLLNEITESVSDEDEMEFWDGWKYENFDDGSYKLVIFEKDEKILDDAFSELKTKHPDEYKAIIHKVERRKVNYSYNDKKYAREPFDNVRMGEYDYMTTRGEMGSDSFTVIMKFYMHYDELMEKYMEIMKKTDYPKSLILFESVDMNDFNYLLNPST